MRREYGITTALEPLPDDDSEETPDAENDDEGQAEPEERFLLETELVYARQITSLVDRSMIFLITALAHFALHHSSETGYRSLRQSTSVRTG